ncbi:hypothetical protein SCUCBS95973_002860 [Sporothrix curviconia]|uniref:Zn(2)-C6 fungal-type domain-containing protein n=1 Tax=Sporothrix curviconia TaxID=1260050 RepID=A0ABP0BAJ2_9PEZI
MDSHSPLATATATAPASSPTSATAASSSSHNAPPPHPAPKDKHRVSRACIACRQRKTRCDLYSHGTPGDPPCTRCFQERLECTLATSRRGGRRPRRTDAAKLQQQHQQCLSNNTTATALPSSPSPAPSHRQARRMTGADIDGNFAASDLLNPSDALNLLAQVADLDGEHDQEEGHGDGGHGHGHRGDSGARRRGTLNRQPSSHGQESSSLGLGGAGGSLAAAQPVYFPPIADGHLSLADASYLLRRYHEHYHPFFPVADGRVFDGRGIDRLAQTEPHLLTSILTVASKDDPAWHRVHEACASHMDTLVSRLISRGSTSVGAVEALLILAEWAPQQQHSFPQQQQQQHRQQQQQQQQQASPDAAPTLIGRGEEDQGAWMQIGVAIRLAYLQGLEQTGLLASAAHVTRSADFERKRIAWAACYMSDREVSIRLGRGFWSRGPGPSTVLNAGDFPTLRTQQAGAGDLAQLFQARLEMTQLFSNAHDILYSSTTHREQLFVGGEYVRYIDDFTAVLRKWKLVWGGLSLTPSVKAALILSYEFLRLYINAFAFQATISRAITRARQSPPPSRAAVRPLFADLAGQPDARFIYESIDAANTLLSTLNDFIDPATALRYMPLKYYLYVIYAAVFLFKARVAGALAGESGSSARRTINVTIERLQRSSVNPHGLGQRYARSLYLLWRKSADRAAAVRSEATAAAAAAAAAQKTAAGTPTATAHAANSRSSSSNANSNSNSNSGQQSPMSHAGGGDVGGGGGGVADNVLVGGTTMAATMATAGQAETAHDVTGGMHHTMGGDDYTRLAATTTAAAGGATITAAATTAATTELLDPLKGFSWRDLDGLGQFIGNDMNFMDITFTTPMSDSDHGTATMEVMTDAWQDILWSGSDVIF